MPATTSIVEALLAHGADERAPDETGKPPIVYAAASARLDIVKRLLARNIDINARYPNDLTLLMWASGPDEAVPEAQAIEVVSYLLDAGAHIDDRDDRGRTALMIAAEGGHAEIANLLLARGADPSLKDKAGKRAADLTVLSALRERLTPRCQHVARMDAARSGPCIASRSSDCARSIRATDFARLKSARYSASAARSSGDVAIIRSDMPGLLPRARVRKSAMVLVRYSRLWPARRGTVPSPWN